MDSQTQKKIKRVKYLIEETFDKIEKILDTIKENDLTDEIQYDLEFLIARMYNKYEWYNDAIDKFQKLLTKATSDYDKSECNYFIGISYLEKENYSEAIMYLKKALEYPVERNQRLYIYDGLASSYKLSEHYQDAIAFYENIINTFVPFESDYEKERIEYAHHSISLCYWKLEQEDKADEYFNKLLSLPKPHKKNLAWAYGTMGHRLYEKKNWKEALKNYRIAKKYAQSKENKKYWQEYIDDCKEQMKKIG